MWSPLGIYLPWDSGSEGRWRRAWVLGSEYLGLNLDASVDQPVTLLCLSVSSLRFRVACSGAQPDLLAHEFLSWGLRKKFK